MNAPGTAVPTRRTSRAVLFLAITGSSLLGALLMHWLDGPDEGWRRPGNHLRVLLHMTPKQSPDVMERSAEGPAAMVTPLDLGVPEYPRAVRTSSLRTQSSKRSTASAYYLSPDAPERVLAFYKGKLGKEPGFVIDLKTDRTLLSLAHGTTDFTLINIIPDVNHPGGTMLTIEHTPAPFPAIAP